jgi:hypothetical protein
MKRSLVLIACLVGSLPLVTGGGAQADVSAGACVAGTGADVNYATLAVDQFVGVNVGMNSETGAFESKAEFEKQCCAETGRPPDCFAPVR